jgi:hypothetical protein
MKKEKSVQIIFWLALSSLLGAATRLLQALTEFIRLFV